MEGGPYCGHKIGRMRSSRNQIIGAAIILAAIILFGAARYFL